MRASEAREALEALEPLAHSDPERAHGEADKILLSIVPESVKDAYEYLVGEAKWWAAS